MAEIRDEFEKMRASVRAKPSGQQATTFVGRVVNRGAMPSAPESFVVVNPVTIAGGEAEGGPGVRTVDATTDVLACWLGSTAPVVGRDVVVYSVANRWVTQPFATPSAPCGLPKRNLTISVGSGPKLMAWNGGTQWQSACVDQILYRLNCTDGAIVFTATYFPTGACPSGNPSFCTSGAASPYGLTVVQEVISPLMLVYSVGGCTFLAAQGYTQFVVTE